MKTAIREKYKKYFGDLFESLEKEYNAEANPSRLLEKYKKLRQDKKSRWTLNIVFSGLSL